jgi:probable phosphomutase (TIGR03848 family)
MPDPTTIVLVRHGQTDWIGHAVAGRQPGVHLNAEGATQARALPTRLAGLPIHALYSSPLERAVETARPLASALRLEVQVCEDATELEFGDWTSRGFDTLEQETAWRRFNSFRSFARASGGELMPEVQTRIIRALERLRARHPGETVVLVSHGDVIRAALAYVLGVPLDLFQRIEIRAASISRVRLYDDGLLVLGVNDTGQQYA